MLSSVPCSRPSKGVKPVRRSDEHLPSSKAAPRPSGVGAKKPGGPSSVASRGGGGVGKVIDSRSKAGAGPRKNTPTTSSARKPISKKEAGNKVGIVPHPHSQPIPALRTCPNVNYILNNCIAASIPWVSNNVPTSYTFMDLSSPYSCSVICLHFKCSFTEHAP